MINGKKIAIVLPAFNAEKTLGATIREVTDLVDIRSWSTTTVQMEQLNSPINWG